METVGKLRRRGSQYGGAVGTVEQLGHLVGQL